jgi:predicted nucleic acid-binding protein
LSASDAGPLIWLSKCSILNLLNKLYAEVMIPEAVYEEAVTRGIEKGYTDAQLIRRAIEEGWIKVLRPSGQFIERVKAEEVRLSTDLGEGEREAMALALEKRTTVFLTDDEDAHRTGKALGLEPKGVLYLLLKGVKDGHIDKEKATESLGKMLDEGLWLSPEMTHRFHEALNQLY